LLCEWISWVYLVIELSIEYLLMSFSSLFCHIEKVHFLSWIKKLRIDPARWMARTVRPSGSRVGGWFTQGR
jgi:hypothetical protein